MPFPPATPPTFSNLKNNVATTLAVAMASNDTQVSVVGGTGSVFPPAPFYLSCEFEVMLCSSRTNDTLVVSRAQDGTTATSHPINSVVEMRDTAVIIRDAYAGVNSAFTSINDLGTQVGNKNALPADTVFLNTTQELTHKTLDLVDSAKANVIIGTVTPDPAALNYPNLLINGGFDIWTYPDISTIPAGGPASGSVSAQFSNEWRALKLNDSSISTTKSTAHSDPSFPSGYSVLANVTTVQVNDVSAIYQLIDRRGLSSNDLTRLTNNPLSVSSRLKLVSGNIQARFVLISSTDNTINQTLTSAWVPVSSSSYQDFKFENQVPLNNVANNVLQVEVDFKGVGQVAIGSVMLSAGPIATKFTPDTPVYNGRLGSDVARANLLTNGGFEIWQRGTGPFSANTSYSADRWVLSIGASSSLSINRQTGLNSPFGASYSYIHAASSQLIQKIENATELAGKTVSFSIDVFCNTANAVRILVWDQLSGLNYSAYHPGGAVWKRLTSTLLTSASTTVLQVYVEFAVSCGGALDNAMLVVSSVPADYAPLHPADDLARCLRYYEVIAGGGGGPPSNFVMTGYGAVGQNVFLWVPALAQMVLTPTATKNGTWSIANCGQPTVYGAMPYGATLLVNATAAGQIFLQGAPSANLTLEANP